MGIEKFLLKNKIIFFSNYPGKFLTTFKTGGPIKYFIKIKNLKDLKKVLLFLLKEKINFFVIGRGSNILISDNGFNGAVLFLEGEFKKFYIKKNFLYAYSGALLPKISLYLIYKGYKGFENFLGIPATTGGALIMNAGCYGKNISDFLIDLDVLDFNGNLKKIKKKDISFSYRESSLKKEGIIIKAKFLIEKGDSKEILKNAFEILKKRQENIPEGFSAGSIFKNPEGFKAKELLKEAGLFNFKVGDALIPEKNPNIILNCGNATSSDLLKLINMAKEKVFEKFKIKLEEEIIYLGF